MPCCAAWGCHNRLETDKNFSYHRFPDKIKKKKLLKNGFKIVDEQTTLKYQNTPYCALHILSHICFKET